MSKFLWGAATAAYQIEGAAKSDGRSPSIWDTFSETPGKTHQGDTGLVACDHYNRYPEDVQIMKWMGVNAYRFSISWTRILPDGIGSVNQAGIDFYNRLIDELLAQGIEPWITIYHWDLPQVLQDRGGWVNRECADWFAEYTQVLVENFGDRVNNWITINEPHCTAWFGYFRGWFAPGIADLQASIDAAHHLLLGHGKAVRVIKKRYPHANVGFAPGLTPVEAASESVEDLAAARFMDGYDIRWFMDPVYGRGYPQDVIDRLGVQPPVLDDDLEVIATPTDFLGVNFYLRQVMKADPENEFFGVGGVDIPNAKVTGMGWEVHPQSLTNLLMRIDQDYAPAEIYITENGSAWDDIIDTQNRIEDIDRVEYLRDHLTAMQVAIDSGVPVNGYFAWSLLDNFEWTAGYSKRFGLIYVDYETMERHPKQSAHWYRQHIAEHS